MDVSRRGFFKGLLAASAAAAAVSVIRQAPVMGPAIREFIAPERSPVFTGELNGRWKWYNVMDHGVKTGDQIGNFVGTFEIFPPPDPDNLLGRNLAFDTRF